MLDIKIAAKTMKVNKGIQGSFSEWEEQGANCKHLSTIYFFQLLVHKAHRKHNSLEGLQLCSHIFLCQSFKYKWL